MNVKINYNDLEGKVTNSSLMKMSLVDWRKELAKDCQVYVCGESYLAKRFDQINYQFCGKDVAKEIVQDNLYALLRFKYFTCNDDEVDKYIDKIVSNFCSNLKSTLIKVSFENNCDCKKVNLLASYECAFRNGIYNFKDNKWTLKYDIVDIPNLENKIYIYDYDYCILWYINIDFEPLDISIMDVDFDDFISLFKSVDEDSKCYCFRLLYNMSFTPENKFSIIKFKHLCEIMGYTLLRDFSQYFVMLIGSGQNGKNSLFDGCITHCIFPRPSSNDLDTIENDRFITGSLENRYQNIFLESSAKTYTESKMIKAITGSTYQTIEQKGVNKYSGYINCKFIFAGNDQDKIKFSDTTEGFKRRVNMMEISYKWDAQDRYLKKGDYYDVRFSDDLKEIKGDITNTITFIYFAYLGIKEATNSFKESFKFKYNDYKEKYADIDIDLQERILNITNMDIYNFINRLSNTEDAKVLFFDENKTRLYNGTTFKRVGLKKGFDSLKLLFKDDETLVSYFSEYDCYMSVRVLQKLLLIESSAVTFTTSIKKIFNIKDFSYLYNNMPYIRIRFENNKLKVVR